MSENNSLYAAPNAELSVDQQATEFNKSGLFSLSGRIGRLRYLAYSFYIYICIALLFAGLGRGANASPVLATFIGVSYLIIFIYALVFARRRLNDIGWSGWWNLLFIIPLLNMVLGFILIFKSGSEGANKYGNPAPQNTLVIKIIAFLYPIAIIGLLAATAIPAYQDYIKKAQETAESQQQ